MPRRSFLAAAAALAAVFAFAPGDAAAQSTLRCDSSPGGYNYCQIDTAAGVQLWRQHSRQPCFEGDTWGYDRRGIWVANGCRATFQLGETAPANGFDEAAAAIGALLAQAILGAAAPNAAEPPADIVLEGGPDRVPSETVRCESMKYKFKRCPVRIRSYVELARQYSYGRGQCTFNKTWGYDRSGIWVDGGCRADFSVY